MFFGINDFYTLTITRSSTSRRWEGWMVGVRCAVTRSPSRVWPAWLEPPRDEFNERHPESEPSPQQYGQGYIDAWRTHHHESCDEPEPEPEPSLKAGNPSSAPAESGADRYRLFTPESQWQTKGKRRISPVAPKAQIASLTTIPTQTRYSHSMNPAKMTPSLTTLMWNTTTTEQ
jgi:hypothetical protein